MSPGYALDEWRSLALLSEELGGAAELVRGIHGGMRGYMPGRGRLDWMWRGLKRISERWGERAYAAQQEAISDARGDSEWIDKHETEIFEHQAVAVLARGLNDVEKAERLLSSDRATAERVRELRDELRRAVRPDPAARSTTHWVALSHAVSHD